MAAPANCELAQDGRTANELSQKVIQLIQDLKYNPIVAGTDLPTDLINYDLIKGTLYSALYNPDEWPAVGSAFHALLAGNTTALFEAVAAAPVSEPIFPTFGFEAAYGIQCGDTALRTDNLTDLVPLVDVYYAESYVAGDTLSDLTLTCARWLFRAKEVYNGDFLGVKTKNPLLIIGNTYDPVTPLISARNVSAGFEGSVVLQHDGYGVSFFCFHDLRVKVD